MACPNGVKKPQVSRNRGQEITVMLTSEEKDILRQVAAVLLLSVSDLVRMWVFQRVEHEKKMSAATVRIQQQAHCLSCFDGFHADNTTQDLRCVSCGRPVFVA